MLKFSTKSVQTLTKRHHFISLKTNLFNIIELKKKSQPLVKSFVIYSLCIPGITNIIWAVETNIVYLSQYGTMVTVVIQRCVDHMVSQHHIPTLPGQKRNIAYKHFKVSHQIHFNAHSPRVWLFSKSILFYIPTHNTPSNFSEFGQWPPPPHLCMDALVIFPMWELFLKGRKFRWNSQFLYCVFMVHSKGVMIAI